MGEPLREIHATIHPDGTWDSDEPVSVSVPTKVIMKFEESEDGVPNAVTRAAMDEPLDGLPRFASVDALLADLES